MEGRVGASGRRGHRSESCRKPLSTGPAFGPEAPEQRGELFSSGTGGLETRDRSCGRQRRGAYGSLLGQLGLRLEATAHPHSWCLSDANDENNRASVPRPFVVEPGLPGIIAPSGHPW